MNIEQLKIIIGLISELGDSARSTFLWYLAYEFLTNLLVAGTFIAVPLLTTKAIFKGMKDNDE